jgi:hypothetical protein
VHAQRRLGVHPGEGVNTLTLGVVKVLSMVLLVCDSHMLTRTHLQE